MYVEELVADNTVNTIPPSTLEAFADHGQPQADTIHRNVKGAYQVIEHLNHPDIQINLDSVMAELIEEGIDKFIQPYESLMSSIEEKTKAVSETPEQVAS